MLILQLPGHIKHYFIIVEPSIKIFVRISDFMLWQQDGRNSAPTFFKHSSPLHKHIYILGVPSVNSHNFSTLAGKIANWNPQQTKQTLLLH
jgi:hypothetical protein